VIAAVRFVIAAVRFVIAAVRFEMIVAVRRRSGGSGTGSIASGGRRRLAIATIFF
jgi:hypothetical protein